MNNEERRALLDLIQHARRAANTLHYHYRLPAKASDDVLDALRDATDLMEGVCLTCRLTKAPRGRSVPMECVNGYCTSDCSGYYEHPLPPTKWPGEE